jgi:hypothetical protein
MSHLQLPLPQGGRAISISEFHTEQLEFAAAAAVPDSPWQWLSAATQLTSGRQHIWDQGGTQCCLPSATALEVTDDMQLGHTVDVLGAHAVAEGGPCTR